MTTTSNARPPPDTAETSIKSCWETPRKKLPSSAVDTTIPRPPKVSSALFIISAMRHLLWTSLGLHKGCVNSFVATCSEVWLIVMRRSNRMGVMADPVPYCLIATIWRTERGFKAWIAWFAVYSIWMLLFVWCLESGHRFIFGTADTLGQFRSLRMCSALTLLS